SGIRLPFRSGPDPRSIAATAPTGRACRGCRSGPGRMAPMPAGPDEQAVPPGPRGLLHPARLVTVAFAGAIAVGTLLLALPASSAGPGGAALRDALFTATSAVCVTGLIVVDTPTA